MLSYEETCYLYENYYKNGVSTVGLSKMFGHTHHYYLDAFKKFNFNIRSNKLNSRKYYADFDYFENIDSHEKAYWLGYFYADGFVSNNTNGKKIGMSLAEKDREQLEKLNACLKSTYPINNYTSNSCYSQNTKYCRLLITNDKMFDDMCRHGVVEHKTNILTKPNIDEEYYNSFILGYFDGDGSIFLNNTKYPFYSVSFVGTDNMLSFIHEQFVINDITSKSLNLEKRMDYQDVSYIRYGGNRIISKIYEYLYRDISKTIPLKRKLDLFVKCTNRIF